MQYFYNSGELIEINDKIKHIKQHFTGRVVDIKGGTIQIEADKHINGHDCERKTKNGYGYNASPDYLKLIQKAEEKEY